MQGRTDPFERMEAMFERMRRAAFESWADEGRRPAIDSGRPQSRRFPMGAEQSGSTLPAQGTRDTTLTLEKSEDGYVVVADLPGFEREEIDLTYDGGVLTISGTHEETGEERYRQRTVAESVRVPDDVVVEEVNATYRNGVLEVTLPAEAEVDSDEYRIDIE